MTPLRQGFGAQVRLTTEPFEPGAELTAFCAGRTEKCDPVPAPMLAI